MESNKNAEHINQAAKANKVPCLKCGTLNEQGTAYCVVCGNPLIYSRPQSGNTMPAYQQSPQNRNAMPVYQQSPQNWNAMQAYQQTGSAMPSYQQSQNSGNAMPAYQQSPQTGNAMPAYQKPQQSYQQADQPVEDNKVASASAQKTKTDPDRHFAAFPVFAPKDDVPEEKSVFAEGLPDWDIVPPNVMVRRKKR